MKSGTILTILLIFSTIAFSQNKSDKVAISTLDKAVSKINKSAYQTNIKLTIKTPDREKPSIENMSVKLYKDKFYIKNSDMETFFDGKTQWVYYPSIEEITIMEPSQEELKEISPLYLLRNFKSQYRIVFEQKEKSDNIEIVSLFPNNKKDDIFRIRLYINKSNNEITKIESSFRNGEKISLELSKYQIIKNTENNFSFDAKKYKNATINDMR